MIMAGSFGSPTMVLRSLTVASSTLSEMSIVVQIAIERARTQSRSAVPSVVPNKEQAVEVE